MAKEARTIVSDNEENRTYIDPLSFKYIKIIRTIYNPIGLFPVEKFGLTSRWRIQRFIHPFLAAIFWIFEINFVVQNFHELDFFLLGHCYLANVTTGMVAIRTYIYTREKYDNLMYEFLAKFHIVHARFNSPYYEKMFRLEQKISANLTNGIMISTFLGSFLYSSLPIYNNIRNGVFGREKGSNVTVDLSIYFLAPNFDPRDHVISATIFNIYASLCCSFMTMISDLVVYLMVIQIIAHIYGLINDLENIPKPKRFNDRRTFRHEDMIIPLVDMYDAEENAEVLSILGRCIEHHKMIVTFTHEISSFYGPMLAYNYFYQVTSLCVQLIEISRGDMNTFFRYIFFACLVFSELILMSVIFEAVNHTSEKVIQSVYDIPWEYMNTSNRRIVSVLLHRVQSPIKVTAIGMVPVSLGTMTAILKTTFSYFAFLRTLG